VTRPLPPRDDLVRLIQASAFNARDLLADARVLSDAGSSPRAHALATLAFEEVGKANLCILVIMPPGFISAAEFWDSWLSHSHKLRWARLAQSRPHAAAGGGWLHVGDHLGLMLRQCRAHKAAQRSGSGLADAGLLFMLV
jgi:AbiV family abortive infection protein